MHSTDVFHWLLKYVSLIKLYWAEVITKAQACDMLAHLNTTFSLLNIKSLNSAHLWVVLMTSFHL